jgi:hypothetical protein
MHTTVAFHFCGGDFSSVDLAGSERLSCCESENHQNAYDGGTAIQGVPCCANHYLELDVDDFSSSQQQNLVNGNDDSINPVIFIPCTTSGNTFAADACHRIFPPPDNHAKSDADLLTFIGVLLI